MVRIAVITFCVFIFLTSILISGFEILNRINVGPAVAQLHQIQRDFLDEFLKDQADLATVPLFTQQASREKNAGEILNSRFPWNPGFNGDDEVPVTGTALEIKPRLRELMMRYSKEWMDHNSLFNLESFDFKIFEQLRGYDYWDIELHSPIEKVGVSQPFLNEIELPIPNVTSLMILSQAYMMKAIDTKDCVQTLRDVRQVAKLLLSTENMNLEMSGLRLLDYERVAYNYYVKHKLMSEKDWEPISGTVTSKATRAWPATAGYLRILTQDSTFKKVFGDSVKPVGFCAALNASVPHDWLLKPMLEPYVWGEIDFNKEYKRHADLIASAQSQCRLKYVSRLMKAGSSYDRLPIPSIFTYLPFSRRTYGIKLATVGFTGFETYSDPLSRQRDPSSF